MWGHYITSFSYTIALLLLACPDVLSLVGELLSGDGCGSSDHIQGDSGGICTTLGNDSMSDSKQKSSYEHGFDFERLRSYGHFLIPYTPSCEPRLQN